MPYPDQAALLRDLHQYSAGAESEAAEAFCRIDAGVGPYVERIAATILHSREDSEEIRSDVLRKLWEGRERIEIRSVDAWWQFVGRMAKWTALDLLRARKEVGALPEEIDIADDSDSADDLAFLWDVRRRIERYANELWLGISPDLPQSEIDRRLLAAQLFYVDGNPWQQICTVLNRNGAAPRIDRAVLEGWLCDEGILRLLAYRELHWDGTRLAAHLLEIAPDNAEAELLRLRDGVGEPPSGLDWDEVAFVLWRYRHGMTVQQIQWLKACKISKETYDDITERIVLKFPFVSIMESLVNGARPLPNCRELLRNAAFWERLAFEYGVKDQLPQKDILDRTCPAAAAVGFEMTEAKLNSWLSGERLVNRLAKYALKREHR